MAKDRIGSGVAGGFDPFKSLRKLSSSYTDEKIVLARKLAREGLTYEQMAPLLGYKNGQSVKQYFKINNLPTPDLRRGTVHVYTEAQKQAQAEKMRRFWAATGRHQNDWRGHQHVNYETKNKQGRNEPMVTYSLPDWAEDMRRLYDNGHGVPGTELARRFKVSSSYIYMLLNIMSGNATAKTPWAQEAIRLAGEGKTNPEIAKMFDVTPNRVRDVLNMHQASIRYRKKKELEDKEATTVADRQFEPTHRTDNGLTRNGVIIRCGVEGCNHTEEFIRAHGPVHPVQAANYFRAKGWMIGGGPRADRCPEHAHKAKTARYEPTTPEETKTPVVEEVKAEPTPEPSAPAPVAETPVVEAPAQESTNREMSKADRRIIFNKIEDVYADETIGYKGDWTDQRVAADLGVPVEWVSSIRDENFGPALNQAAVLADVREKGATVMALVKEMKEMQVAMDKMSTDFDTMWDSYVSKAEQFDKLSKEFAELYKTIGH